MAPGPARSPALPAHGPGFLADLVPLVLLALAAAIRPLRIPVLALLVIGFALLRRDARGRGAPWAAAIPVTVSLSWGLVALPPEATDGSTCASATAPFAIHRIVEALLALASLAMLVPLVGGGGGDLGLRRPDRRAGAIAVAAFAVAGPLGLVVGPFFAEPFFGPLDLALGDPAALVPAIAFAVSNGVMEELLYRGALQGWTARRAGLPVAVVGQAVVFGLAHATGPDVAGSPHLLWAAMTAGGLIAGWIVWRTGSLAIPIAAHIGLDLPLYYGNACRL